MPKRRIVRQNIPFPYDGRHGMSQVQIPYACCPELVMLLSIRHKVTLYSFQLRLIVSYSPIK